MLKKFEQIEQKTFTGVSKSFKIANICFGLTLLRLGWDKSRAVLRSDEALGTL